MSTYLSAHVKNPETICEHCLLAVFTVHYRNRVSTLIATGFNLFSQAIALAELEKNRRRCMTSCSSWATTLVLCMPLFSLPDNFPTQNRQGPYRLSYPIFSPQQLCELGSFVELTPSLRLPLYFRDYPGIVLASSVLAGARMD